ncbi:4'-phosphopantetheinyl transferase Sfp [subsurface metagenome]
MLRNDEVHIWRVSLDQNASYVQSLQQILSADEKARARRVYFEKDRKHFIVARGLLRVILSRYLDMKPNQVRFCYSLYGKPGLIYPSEGETLNFNVSHSCGLALYAITRGREVGIDLERIRTHFGCEQIAERFFSPQENAMLRTFPANRVKHKAFFNCWTRKEAYIKAKGEGLSLPLDQFDVSFAPGEPAALCFTSEASDESSRWLLRALQPGPGYVAALVVEGHDWRLKCWEWSS